MGKIKEKKSKNKIIDLSEIEKRHVFFENAADAIFVADAKTKKIVECNKTAEKLLGYPKNRILQMRAGEIHPKDKVKEAMNGFVDQIKKGGVFRTEILTKNKKRIQVSVNAKLIKIGNRSYLQGIFRDISEIVKFENILKDNEERFHGLFESANDAIWLMDKGTFIDCNSRAVEMFKCDDKEDMVNHTPIQFSPLLQPDGQSSKTKALMYIGKALNGHPQRFYWQHKKKDGSLFDAEISLNSLTLQGKTYLQAIGRDITQNKKIEGDILRKNRALKMVSGINQALIRIADEKELLNEACRVAVEIGGYSLAWVGFAEHDKNKTIRSVASAGVGVDYIKKAKLSWADTISGHGPSGIAIRTNKFHISRLIAKDRTMTPWKKNALRWGYQSSIALPLMKNKKAFGMIAIYSEKVNSFDDNEVKILNELADDLAFGIVALGIRKDISKFKKAAQDSGEVIYITDKTGIITFINTEFTNLYGYTPAEVVWKATPRILKNGERGDKEYASFWKDLFAGKTIKDEHKNKSKNGKFFIVESTVSPIFDEKRDILGFLAIQRDITERKKTEDKVRENEERFRNIFNYSAVGVSVLDTRGHWLEVNDALCKITGYSRKELLSENFSDITFIEDKPKGTEAVKKMISGQVNYAQFDKRYVHKNGQIVWVNISTALVRDLLDKPLYFVTHTQDITKLKESEEKFRRLFESAKDSILILDPESGEIKDSNPFVQDLLGYSASELIGKKIFEISPFRDIIENKEKFIELQNKGYVYYDDLPLKTKSGIIKQVEFVSNVYLVNDKKVIQCNIRDITERIKKEKELEQAKNDFLSMASHQLRTPLSAVKWLLESLETATNFTPQQKEKLKNLMISNERIIALVNYLLDVTKIESGKLIINKKLTDVNELFAKLNLTFKNLAESKKKNINITIPPKIKSIYCDPVFLNEALSNLIHNAIIYSDESSKDISVKISERAGDYLISVHNTGIIDDVTLLKIQLFSKFVRGDSAPKVKPEGSGLGLYLAKSIIEASGGKIWCESNAKDGTTFFLTIIKE